MNDGSDQDESQDEGAVLAARRHKLQQIMETGVDPWGQRFDERQWLGDIRQRENEITFVAEVGTKHSLPTAETLGEKVIS